MSRWSTSRRTALVFAVAIALGSLFVATCTLALANPMPHQIDTGCARSSRSSWRVVRCSEGTAMPARTQRGARPGRACHRRTARAVARHPAGGPHPEVGCAPRSRRCLRGCRCLWQSTSPSAGCPPWARRLPSSSSPRHSPTSQSTPLRSGPRSPRASRATRCTSRYATTASAARSRMEAVSWGFVTGFPSSTGRLRIDSPAGGGTLVASVMPLAADQSLARRVGPVSGPVGTGQPQLTMRRARARDNSVGRPCDTPA